MSEILGIARAVHVAATLSLLGTLLFRVLIAPVAFQRAEAQEVNLIDHRLDWVARISFVLAFAATMLWLFLEAASMSGAGNLGEAVGAVVAVLSRTHFGNVILLKMALLLFTAFCLWVRREKLSWQTKAAAVLVGASLLLHADIGHAGAPAGDGRLILVVVQALHLLAAGAWLGGLLPLWLALALPPPGPMIAAKRFSDVGLASVSVLVVTALYNGLVWVGSIAALLHTSYGRWALLKLVLFTALLAVAAVNRVRLTPRLATSNSLTATRNLRRNVVTEACIGLAVVVAAGMLATTPPVVHP